MQTRNIEADVPFEQSLAIINSDAGAFGSWDSVSAIVRDAIDQFLKLDNTDPHMPDQAEAIARAIGYQFISEGGRPESDRIGTWFIPGAIDVWLREHEGISETKPGDVLTAFFIHLFGEIVDVVEYAGMDGVLDEQWTWQIDGLITDSVNALLGYKVEDDSPKEPFELTEEVLNIREGWVTINTDENDEGGQKIYIDDKGVIQSGHFTGKSLKQAFGGSGGGSGDKGGSAPASVPQAKPEPKAPETKPAAPAPAPKAAPAPAPKAEKSAFVKDLEKNMEVYDSIPAQERVEQEFGDQYAYHGTTTDHLDSILKDGLKPRGGAGASQDAVQANNAKVNGTTNAWVAKSAAALASEKGGKPIVLIYDKGKDGSMDKKTSESTLYHDGISPDRIAGYLGPQGLVKFDKKQAAVPVAAAPKAPAPKAPEKKAEPKAITPQAKAVVAPKPKVVDPTSGGTAADKTTKLPHGWSDAHDAVHKAYDKHVGEGGDEVDSYADSKKTPEAALTAFVSNEFLEMNSNPNHPANAKLKSMLDKLPDYKPKSGKIHRVLGFETADAAAAYVKSLNKPQEKSFASWTTMDPTAPGATPANNIGLDLASQFGDHTVILSYEDPKGAKDISFAYGGKKKTGVEQLTQAGHQFQVLDVKKEGDKTLVRLGNPTAAAAPVAKPAAAKTFKSTASQSFKEPWAKTLWDQNTKGANAGDFVGAGSDMPLKIAIGGYDKTSASFVVSGENQHARIVRTVSFKDGKPFAITNESMEVKPGAPPGYARTMLKNQILGASQAGISELVTEATRNDGRNGYYTWPRYGYDADIESMHKFFKPSVKAKFPEAKTLLDIMATKEGRDWWKENGNSVKVKFDTTPGSRSRKVFDAYMSAKGEK